VQIILYYDVVLFSYAKDVEEEPKVPRLLIMGLRVAIILPAMALLLR
jgi:hypothetical protein